MEEKVESQNQKIIEDLKSYEIGKDKITTEIQINSVCSQLIKEYPESIPTSVFTARLVDSREERAFTAWDLVEQILPVKQNAKGKDLYTWNKTCEVFKSGELLLAKEKASLVSHFEDHIVPNTSATITQGLSYVLDKLNELETKAS